MIRRSYQEITGKRPPHPFCEDVTIWRTGYVGNCFDFSFVVPVFNKEESILRFLKNFEINFNHSFEVIFVNDASEDRSLEVLKKWVESQNIAITIASTEVPVFETASDNIGFSLSCGEIICELQCDIYIDDSRLLQRASAAFRCHQFSSLSSRCAHSWLTLLSKKQKLVHAFKNKSFNGMLTERVVGRSGKDMFSIPENLNEDIIYFADTNNRGPWFIDGNEMRSVLLDSDTFFLGGDDHYFNLKQKVNEGTRAAYIPSMVYSISSEGSTRQKRRGKNLEIYEWMKSNKAGEKFLLSQILKTSNEPITNKQLYCDS